MHIFYNQISNLHMPKCIFSKYSNWHTPKCIFSK